ncbi:MAG: hypothetical protein U1E76_15680 [Planctomycetota bacterium]
MADTPSPPPLPGAAAPGAPLPASVGTTTGAAPADDEAHGRMFPCEGCGADLKFEIGAQRLQCPFCGYVKQLTASTEQITEQDFRAALKKLADRKLDQSDAAAATATHDVRCSACGATVFFTGTLTSSECPTVAARSSAMACTSHSGAFRWTPCCRSWFPRRPRPRPCAPGFARAGSCRATCARAASMAS